MRDGLTGIHSGTDGLDEAARDLSDAVGIERSGRTILERFGNEAEPPQALWTRSSLLAALRTALKEIDVLNDSLDEAKRGLKQATLDGDRLSAELSQATTRVLDLKKELGALNALRLSNWEKKKLHAAELKAEGQRRKELEVRNRELEGRNRGLKKKLRGIMNSTSWRLTAPLRFFGRLRRS